MHAVQFSFTNIQSSTWCQRARGQGTAPKECGEDDELHKHRCEKGGTTM
jgi:hypothetical protein